MENTENKRNVGQDGDIRLGLDSLSDEQQR